MPIDDRISPHRDAHRSPRPSVTDTTVVIVDADGTVVSVNPDFEQTAGYSRYEILGKRVDELAAGSRDALFFRLVDESVRSGRSRKGVLPGPRRGEKANVAVAAIHPVSDAVGDISGYVAVHDPASARSNSPDPGGS